MVMGHIDHGKSTLLDYIRNTNVVATESGGITQHISAYEAIHKTKEGTEKRITFLDTPGHEAFTKMRTHGAKTADIAILVVSAEDSVKAQTLEAIAAIKEAKLPFIVAVNKIDRPSANPDKVRRELAEHEVYVEGYGGDVPSVDVSAKEGTGISDLLDLILLLAEFAELAGMPAQQAEGFVIESHLDPKRGVSATLIITNGTLEKGSFICAGDAIVPVRSIEHTLGQTVSSATFSSPVVIAGFSKTPPTGSLFRAYANRNDAEKAAEEYARNNTRGREMIIGNSAAHTSLPVIIKTDVLGTCDAVIHELGKIWNDKINIKVVQTGVGDISENDVRMAAGSSHAIIIGFRVGIDRKAREAAQRVDVHMETFAIIYNITDYLEEEVKKHAPKEETAETRGEARILKIFSTARDKQVVGGSMLTGVLTVGNQIKILRRDIEIGTGKILELQRQKTKVSEVPEGEFGVFVESRTEIAQNDTVVAFEIVTK